MGSSLPLTLINAVLYFSYLSFNFSIIFFKPRNSSVIKVFVSYYLSWVNSRLDPIFPIFPKTEIKLIYNFYELPCIRAQIACFVKIRHTSKYIIFLN
jgi:hypothetical protein